MSNSPRQAIQLPFPLKGLDVGWAFNQQPEGTVADCLNVGPIDPISQRLRGGQRAGLTKFCNTQIASAAIQNLNTSVVTIPNADRYTGYVCFAYERHVYIVDASYVAVCDLDLGTSFDVGESSAVFEKNGCVIFGGGTTKVAATVPSTTVACIYPDGTLKWAVQLADDAGVDADSYCLHLSYNAVLHQVLVAVSMNDSYTGADADATHFILDAETGAILWCADFRGANDIYLGACSLDDDGTCFIAARKNSAWPGAAGNDADLWSVTPDMTSPGPTNHTCIINWWDYSGGAMHESGTMDVLGDELLCQNRFTTKIWLLNKNTGAVIEDEDYSAGAVNVLYEGRFLSDGNSIWREAVAAGGQEDYCRHWTPGGALAQIFTYSTAAGAVRYRFAINHLDQIVCVGADTATYTGAGANANILRYSVGGALQAGAATNPVGYTFGVVDVYNPTDTAARRVIHSYAVCDGSIYQMTSTAATVLTDGASVLDDTLGVVSTAAFQDVFFIDGTHSVYYDYSDGKVKTWTATDGTLPAAASIMALYRGRLVLAGTVSDPHNWFMSRSGDPFDWDYAPATTDAVMAVAGNTCDAGKVGDVVTCLASYSDDTMIIGCDHSLWLMRGDPAAGGIIDAISYQTGILGKFAFAYDPNGVFYFFGQSQVWRMDARGSVPESLSVNRMDSIFRAIDYDAYECHMIWDNEQGGLHIFFVPNSQPSEGTIQYFWHQRTDSWWKDQYPAAQGPTCVATYDADEPNDRALLFGGYDGYVRRINRDVTSDDGTAIGSYVFYTPIMPWGPLVEGRMIELKATMSIDSDPVLAVVSGGPSAEYVTLESPIKYSRSLVPGQNPTIRQRVNGTAFQVRLYGRGIATETWAIETLTGIFVPGGRSRRRGLV